MSNVKSGVMSLNITDLDVEELEQRLEMALIPLHVRDDDGDGGDPPKCGSYVIIQPCGTYTR
jgi:hypothetical protein